MKPRHTAALALGPVLSGCESRLLASGSLLDWLGLCLIVLVIVVVGIGFAGLVKMIPK